MRWLSWGVVLFAVVLAIVFLRGTVADHPLASVPRPPLCGLLEAAPGASNSVRPVGVGSPLAAAGAGAAACDLVLGGAQVGVMVTTRRDLSDRGDARDTDAWLSETSALIPVAFEELPGPWRRALLLDPGQDLLIEDNGVIIKIAGAPDRVTAVEAARRAAEALRAAPPPDAG
jgi:hypothetical protein